jgi:formamidopyrimidine-DNA glycosylase
MPELPDIVVYLEALEQRVLGHILKRVRIAGPFLLRTALPPIDSVQGQKVIELRRIGKRIALGFDNGMLTLTEAGTQKRASLHLFADEVAMAVIDPGGLEVLSAKRDAFGAVLTSENHTLKRALTDPHLFSGIGNAYSDEILFHAQLSPVFLTRRLEAEAIDRLYRATRETLNSWTKMLSEETHGKFPEKVTAFREEMYVHGRYGQPCRRCGTKIQRIRYASNETNYCPWCQTGGKLLADRALSRLLREDWPRSLDEMEERLAR